MIDELSDRELDGKPRIVADYFDEHRLVDKLRRTQTLNGHEGCVNTLRWSSDGSLLASGSDDVHIIIWRGTGEKLHKMRTNHMGNIFAVDFVHSEPLSIISGSADHMIWVDDVEHGAGSCWQTNARTKRIASCKQDPFMFWAAVEDGIVKEIDVRSESVKDIIKMDSRLMALKSIDVSDARPHMMALAIDNTKALIYDRRMLNEPLLNLQSFDPSVQRLYSTHIAFNSTGTQCVVNQGGSAAYVFDLIERNTPKVFNALEGVLDPAMEKAPTIKSSALPFSELREVGATYLKEKQFFKGIEYYTGLINREFEQKNMRSVMYSNRAMGYLGRRFMGDTYQCVRDCIKALEIHPGNSKALWRLTQALILLEQKDLAEKCCSEFKRRFNDDELLKKLSDQVETMKNLESSETVRNLPNYHDYSERYVGAMNLQTDIKEANFFGSRDQFIVAGSDCGSMVIWSRDTQQLLGMWKSDSHIVNIVQPHPSLFLIAASGIDDDIKIWEPRMDEEKEDEERISDPIKHIDKNHMSMNNFQMRMMAHQFFRAGGNECLMS